ncbi:MAG: ABC transporter ATP-binding protein/permease [Clostridiales bacterium]|nr:ABC transporter ATP-binding protein/permease [Clostridiales bacterium]
MSSNIFSSILKTKKKWLALVSVAIILQGFIALVMPSYSRYVFDSIATSTVSIHNIVLIGIVIIVVIAAVLAFQRWAVDRFVKEITFEIDKRFITSLVRLPGKKIVEFGEGRILTNFSQDINSVSDMLRSGIELIRIPFEMIVAAAFLIYTNWVLGLLVIILLPPVTLIGRQIGKALENIKKKYMTQTDSQFNMINRILKSINVIKTYAADELVKEDYFRIITGKFDLDKKMINHNSLFSGITEVFMGLPFVLVFIFSALLFQVQNITVGTLTLFLELLNRITVPFVRFNTIFLQYKQTKISFERLNELLSVQEDSANEEKANEKKALLEPIRQVRFQNVNFKYLDKNVIHNLGITFEGGKHYAIIGENGSGKTTCMKLLLNLLSPDSGAILANDRAYDTLRFQELRKDNNIVYIEDAPCTLFDDFDKNIILDKGMDNGLYAEVLKTVGLFDSYGELKAKSPDELSAGQKQRVSLARGLYHIKPGTLLVMDEPFSALDANGCSQMYANLADYKKRYGLTILEITHNLTDMNRFDSIYYFEDGRVALEGSHEVLMEEPKYRRYVENYNREKQVS